MAGNKLRSKLKKMRVGIGLLLLAVFLCAAVYLAAVLLSDVGEESRQEWVVEDEQTPVAPMQAAVDSNPQALAAMFGAALPYWPGGTPRGEARNGTHDGQNVRIVTLQYQGFTVMAVRPASAAPLLLHDELSLSLRTDLSVLNMPAALAQSGEAHCLYFSDNAASYSIYAPAASEEEFLNLARQLALARP